MPDLRSRPVVRRSRRSSIVALTMFFALLGGLLPATVAASEQDEPASGGPAAVDPRIDEQLANAERVPVIVTFDDPAPTHAPRPSRLAAVEQRVEELTEPLPSAASDTARPLGDLPQMAIQVDEQDLERLAADPRVRSIAPDSIKKLALTNAQTRVGTPSFWPTGGTGTGQTVAVIDTGVDKNHPFLGNVVAEGCFTSTAFGGTALCPGPTPTNSTAPNSGLPCNVMPDCSHGTHVAGIATGGTGGAFSGTAPGANVIAVQVFTRFNSGCAPFPNPCIGAFNSDIISGLNFVHSLRNTHSIAAVNLSLGGPGPGGVCDNDPLKPAIDQLRNAGIATVAASGNEGQKNRVGSPACISSAISVGSTRTSNDTVSTFSNSGANLDLLAPGETLTSSVPNGTTGSFACPAPFGTGQCQGQMGTSMATPMVVGAFALMRSRTPTASINTILSQLKSSGTPITDSANSRTTPRLRLNNLVSLPTFHPLPPTRVLDTRNGTGIGGTNPLGPGQTAHLKLTNVGGVPPNGVSGVLLNVTSVFPTQNGFLTVFPRGFERPTVSNLNGVPGTVRPNLVAVKLGHNGSISLFNSHGSAHYVADLAGWYDDGGTAATGDEFLTRSPLRILDTRDGTGGVPVAKLGPGQSLTLNAAANCPAGPGAVTAVTMNVTAVDATQLSHLTIWPSNEARPNASHLNFNSGAATPNLTTVKVSPTGTVSFFNASGTVNVIADLSGCHRASNTGSGRFVAVSPVRILDTRNGTGGVSGKLGPGQSIIFNVADKGGIPNSGASAVVVNVTVTEPTQASHLTVGPGNEAAPNASNLNFSANQTVPNLVKVKIAPNGTIRIRNNSGSTHVIVDVSGYIV